MNGKRVRVRRERPTALAWSIALATTMLAVYMLTLTPTQSPSEAVSAATRVTREVTLAPTEGWCVTLGAWPTQDQARIEASGFVDRGAAGTVIEAGGAWHVLGALYDSEKAADSMAKKLQAEGISEAGLLRLYAGEVRLRITAPEAQIALIESADAFLRDRPGQLNLLAGQLDRGEAEARAVRALCALDSREAGELSARLKACGGVEDNALCEGLAQALDALAQQLDALTGAPVEVTPALSGLLRRVGIEAFLAVRSVRTALAG